MKTTTDATTMPRPMYIHHMDHLDGLAAERTDVGAPAILHDNGAVRIHGDIRSTGHFARDTFAPHHDCRRDRGAMAARPHSLSGSGLGVVGLGVGSAGAGPVTAIGRFRGSRARDRGNPARGSRRGVCG